MKLILTGLVVVQENMKPSIGLNAPTLKARSVLLRLRDESWLGFTTVLSGVKLVDCRDEIEYY